MSGIYADTTTGTFIGFALLLSNEYIGGTDLIRRLVCLGVLIVLVLAFTAAPVCAGSSRQGTYDITSPKTEFVNTNASSASSYSYAIMRPTKDQLTQWNNQYKSEQSASTILASSAISSQSSGTTSLLEYLNYTPSERDQGSCGNCWVWTSTGAIEIAHTQQNNVFDRLSVQYVNSKYNNGGKSPFSSVNFACNGGTASAFSNFYNLIGKYGGNKIAIPWSNNNSAFGDAKASTHTLVDGDTIQTTPHYALNDMSVQRIETNGASQTAAIANIKSVIDSGKAVYLSFYLPDQSAWSNFSSFWASGDEEDSSFTLDSFSGSEYTSSGGAHAVLVTGYTDDGTTGYWQCLNSWGAPSNRPNGLFYVNMYMDYSALYTYGGDSVPVSTWETIGVTYAGEEPTPDPNGTVYNLSPDFEVSPSFGYPPLTVHFTDLSTGSPSSWKWDFGDEGGSAIRNPNHTYSQPGHYSVSLLIGKGGQTAVTKKENIVTVKYPYVNITAFPRPDGGNYPIPTDQDNDGRFEDVDGNKMLDFKDPSVLLNNLEFAMKKEPVLQFDFDGSGFIGYDDVVALQKMV